MRQLPIWILLAVVAQFVALMLLFGWHISLRDITGDERALLPTDFHESIAIVVPFTAKDENALVEALEAWRTYMPCTHQHSSFLRAEVFFYFNHDLSQDARLKHTIRTAALAIRGHCFRQFHYVSANLQGTEDVYDKRRVSEAWTAGPNAMFYRLFLRRDSTFSALLNPFRVVLWIEADVRPFRSNWLVAWALRTHYSPEFWVMGSSYAGECAEDTQGECRYLGSHIAHHINGNAAYHYASDSFREFLLKQVLGGEFKLWPFDLAIHLQMRGVSEPEQRRLLPRYVYTTLIQNYGDYPYTPESLGSDVALVHGLKSNRSLSRPVAIPLPPQEVLSMTQNTAEPLLLDLENLPNFFSMLAEPNSRNILEPLYRTATLAVIESRTDEKLLTSYRRLLSAIALERNCSFLELSHFDPPSDSVAVWNQQPVCVFLLRNRTSASALRHMTESPRALCTVTAMPPALVAAMFGISDSDDSSSIAHILKQNLCLVGGAMSWAEYWEVVFAILGIPKLRSYILLENATGPQVVLEGSQLDLAFPSITNETRTGFRSWQLEMGSRLPYLLETNCNAQRQIAIVFASGAYEEMYKNWVHFVRNAGMVHVLGVATDSKAEQFMLRSGLAVMRMFIGTTGSDSYHSEAFKKVVNMRYKLLLHIMRLGYDIFILDLDVVILQNPMPFRYPPEHDMSFLSDSRIGFLEKTPNDTYNPFVNGGVFYGRSSSQRAVAFLETVVAEMQRFPSIHDQDILNRILTNLTLPLNYEIFDRTTWANGFVYWDLALPQQAGLTPVLVHGNWAEGFRTKVYRFKETGMWYSYPGNVRVREGRYLAYWNDLKDDGLNNQFVSLRSALAIAHILNRTLILPRFSAEHKKGNERFFDYYFDYQKFADNFPAHVPSSFMSLISDDLLHRAVVHLSARNSTWKANHPHGPDPVVFSAHYAPLGATDAEIRQWLTPYEAESVLFVDDMFRAFLKFEDERVNKQFTARFRKGVAPVPPLLGIPYQIQKNIGEYNCVHLRRRDFLDLHTTEKPISEVARLSTDFLPTTEAVYIATDDQDLEEVRKAFEEYYPRAIFLPEYFPAWEVHAYNFTNYMLDGKLGIMDQQVCARAKKFVGNLWSTFTMHICAIREELGFDPPCVDIYLREKPKDMPYV